MTENTLLSPRAAESPNRHQAVALSLTLCRNDGRVLVLFPASVPARSEAGTRSHGRLQPCQQQQGQQKVTVCLSPCDEADYRRKPTHDRSDDRKQLGRRCPIACRRGTIDLWPEHHRRLPSVSGDPRMARRTCGKCSISSLICFDFWRVVEPALCATAIA